MSGRSLELEAIPERWVRAAHAGDGRVVCDILSRDPGALYFIAGPARRRRSLAAPLAKWHSRPCQ